MSLCAVYTVLIRLISTFLCDLRRTHGGSNSWEKYGFQHQNGAIVLDSRARLLDQDSFDYRKIKSCRQHDLFVLRLTLTVVTVHAEP